MKAFAKSQYVYCLFASMFHDRGINDKINSLHDRALRVTSKISSSFQDLFIKEKEFSFSRKKLRNIQAQATEMFKVKNNGRISS